MLERIFKLSRCGTDVRTELLAGITTFMTMAYILAVNPMVLGETGMNSGAVFTATALISAVASFFMGFAANLPFVLSSAMGLNAYFAYTVVKGMGYSWEMALAAVFTEGIIFIVLSMCNIREAIFNAIPANLKQAVSVGIGLFICFIGLQNAHISVAASTLVTGYSFHQSIASGNFHTEGITVLLALIGILVMAFLVIKQVKGNILVGILITWGLGIVCQLLGIYRPDPAAGYQSLIPTGIISAPASLEPTFMKMDFSALTDGRTLDFVVVIFAFLFVDMFDTLGTLIGCASKANMLDKDGKLRGIKGALFADAIGTLLGACVGTSTISTFVESSSGIAEGGRTGLTSVTAGILFLCALFFSPVFLAIPSFATAPALVLVGFFMMQQVTRIQWDDTLEAMPCFICIFAMAFMYSISDGIAYGIISSTVLNVLSGRRDRVTPLMCILSVFFIVKYIFI